MKMKMFLTVPLFFSLFGCSGNARYEVPEVLTPIIPSEMEPESPVTSVTPANIDNWIPTSSTDMSDVGSGSGSEPSDGGTDPVDMDEPTPDMSDDDCREFKGKGKGHHYGLCKGTGKGWKDE